MPTTLIAPKTAAELSADVPVSQGGSVNFGLYRAGGGSMNSEVVVPLTRKNPAGTYEDTGLSLSASTPNQVVYGAGVYRAEKPVTAAVIGVMTD